MDRRSSSRAFTETVEVAAQPRELRIRLADLAGVSGDMRAVASLFAGVYEPFRAMKGAGARREAWVAFVAAEGLRVEDLDPQPGEDAVRALACALVRAGFGAREAAVVVGRHHTRVSEYARMAGVRRGRGISGSADAASEGDYRELVLAELMVIVDAAPLVPGDALVQMEDQLKVIPTFVQECRAGLNQGGPVSEGFDWSLRRCVRLLNDLGRDLRGLGEERGLQL